MAKKKGKKRLLRKIPKESPVSRSGAGFGTKQNFEQEINKAKRLLSRAEDKAVLDYLQELTQRYPSQIELLELQMTIAAELEDGLTCGKAAAQLLELDPHHGDGLYIMASLALQKIHPVLAWHLSQRALAQDDDHPMTEGILAVMGKIEEGLDELVAEVEGLPREEAIELLINHEWGQLYLGWGEYEKCKAAELKVIAQKPDFMPAYNNLSLIALTTGDVEEAIAQAEKVLTFEPENVHALANLIRYCFLQGQPEQAKPFGEKLKASQADAWDPYTKKIEGLTYLGDTAGVLEIWQQAEAAGESSSTLLGGLVFHWVAVAQARTGNLTAAKKLWREALKRSPDLKLAQANLDDLLLPLGQRNGPWEFEGHAWMSPPLQTGLLDILASLSQNSGDPRFLPKAFRRLFADYPGLITWLETMFTRGDSFGRQMSLELVKEVRSPELLEILKSFALSPHGPDHLRNQAAQFLVEEDMLASGNIPMWFKGEQTNIALLNFQIHEEPELTHSKEVIELAAQALDCLRQQTKASAKEAEALLQEALEIEVSPDLLNNLAVAYYFQDWKAEGMALRLQIIRDYPNYIPARTFVAHQHLLANELQKAEDVLQPILGFKRIHLDDFVHFVKAYIDLLVAGGKVEGARSWLNTWESITPKHPDLKVWQQHVVGGEAIKLLKEKKSAKSKKTEKSKKPGKTKDMGKTKKTGAS